jgi:ornithine carbamoyltransferase
VDAEDDDCCGPVRMRSLCTACRPIAAKKSRAEVIDGPQSVVWDEAENRLHAQKALMEYLLLGRVDD